MNIPKLSNIKKSGASAYLKWLSASKYGHSLDVEPRQVRFVCGVSIDEIERLQVNFVLVSNFCDKNKLDIWSV